MLKAKEDAVQGLTEGIELLFKQNKVDYITGTAFVSPTTISVQLNEGGDSSVEAKNITITTGSEVTPFPGSTIEIDEEQIFSSTDTLSPQKVPGKTAVIGGGILDWRRAACGVAWALKLRSSSSSIVLGVLTSTRKFRASIYLSIFCVPVLYAYWLLRKQFQKSLTRQGPKFKLSTKVLSAEKKDGKVIVTTEAAKDGKQEMVRCSQTPHLPAGS
jgi:dihydrolipoamide dehydrogenase